MSKAPLARKLVLLPLGLLLLDLILWAVLGRSRLDDQIYLDYVEQYLAAPPENDGSVKSYFLCESAYAALEVETITSSRTALAAVGADLLTAADLKPLGELSLADCDCFATCFRIRRSNPFFGVVDRTWRPDIGYSESGATVYYVFLFWRWYRVGVSGNWSQW